MSTTSFDIAKEHLADVIAVGTAVMPGDLTMKFVREQAAGPRTFSVSGPKADAVRALIFADQGLTRKQISELVGCSVSRVAEVVWGLEYDEIDFPAIPLRAEKPAAEPKPGLTPQDDKPLTGNEASELIEQLEASIEARKAEQAGDAG